MEGIEQIYRAMAILLIHNLFESFAVNIRRIYYKMVTLVFDLVVIWLIYDHPKFQAHVLN